MSMSFHLQKERFIHLQGGFTQYQILEIAPLTLGAQPCPVQLGLADFLTKILSEKTSNALQIILPFYFIYFLKYLIYLF